MSATIEDSGSIIGQLWKSKTQPGRIVRITDSYSDDIQRVRVGYIVAASIMDPSSVESTLGDLLLESLLAGYRQVG